MGRVENSPRDPRVAAAQHQQRLAAGHGDEGLDELAQGAAAGAQGPRPPLQLLDLCQRGVVLAVVTAGQWGCTGEGWSSQSSRAARDQSPGTRSGRPQTRCSKRQECRARQTQQSTDAGNTAC